MTRAFSRAYRLQVGLQIAAGILAFLVWMAPVPHLRPFVPATISPPTVSNLPANEYLPSMQALITRPLFAQSRRPPPPPPVALPVPAIIPPKPVPSTGGMVLLGVLHNGSMAVALVTLPTSSNPQEVKVGDALEDWTVTKILKDQIFLRSGDTIAQLLLPRPSTPSRPSGISPSPATPHFPPLFFPNPYSGTP